MMLLHVFCIAFDVCSVDLQFCFLGSVLVCPLSKSFCLLPLSVSQNIAFLL